MVGSVVEAARGGLPVLGICNGFQVLCEAGLLPGALTRNVGLHFVCRDQRLRFETTNTPWTSEFVAGEEVVVPVKHGEGRYAVDATTLAELERDDRVVVRYTGGNPNGSVADIAGVCSASRSVVGLMPHPEHAVEDLTGPSTDGLRMFTSVLTSLLPQ
jgi:phosphoribosylformylglycinamidine synthase